MFFSESVVESCLLFPYAQVIFVYFDLLLFVFRHDCRFRSFLIGRFKVVQREMASISRNEQGDYLILTMSSVPK